MLQQTLFDKQPRAATDPARETPPTNLDDSRDLADFQAGEPETDVVAQLQRKIHQLQTAQRRDGGSVVSTGCAAADALLPEGGLARGTLTEWFAGAAMGGEILSLQVARRACLGGDEESGREVTRGRGKRRPAARSGALVIVDGAGTFYPPAAALWGVPLDNAIVLRPRSQAELYWAIDQCLRCPAVAAVWGRLEKIGERWFRRFQLSAESSGAMGLFVRPLQCQRDPSWSEVQWRVHGFSFTAESARRRLPRAARSLSRPSLPSSSPVPAAPPAAATASLSRHVGLQCLRCRSGKAQLNRHRAALTLEIDFTSGDLRHVRTEPAFHQAGRPRTAGEGGNGVSLSKAHPKLQPCDPDREPKRTRKADPLPLVSQLAHPVAGRRPARA